MALISPNSPMDARFERDCYLLKLCFESLLAGSLSKIEAFSMIFTLDLAYFPVFNFSDSFYKNFFKIIQAL